MQAADQLWNSPASKRLGALGERRVFMRTNRTPDQWNNWCLARSRHGTAAETVTPQQVYFHLQN